MGIKKEYKVFYFLTGNIILYPTKTKKNVPSVTIDEKYKNLKILASTSNFRLTINPNPKRINNNTIIKISFIL